MARQAKGQRSLSDEEILEARSRAGEGATAKDIAAMLGVTPDAVYRAGYRTGASFAAMRKPCLEVEVLEEAVEALREHFGALPTAKDVSEHLEEPYKSVLYALKKHGVEVADGRLQGKRRVVEAG